MKKPFKILLIVLAVITVILVIAAVIMLRAVSGDNLFYMDSKLGHIYAVSYRWVTLAAGILVLFWIVFAVRLRKRKTAIEMTCKQCGNALPANSKFCPSCGMPVRGSSDGKEETLISERANVS